MLGHILVVDDDQKITCMLKEALSREGFKVACAKDSDETFDAISRRIPDLLILDWKLPEKSGYDVCRILRNDPKTAALPIIMLTSVAGIKEKVDALELGADDYITKPFHLSELRARVKAVLRRKAPWLIQTRIIEYKRLKLDPANYKAYIQNRDAGLTKAEFEILYLLAINSGRIVQRSYLESRVLGIEYSVETRALDVHVSRLREKLGPNVNCRIETAKGLGYIFTGDEN